MMFRPDIFTAVPLFHSLYSASTVNTNYDHESQGYPSNSTVTMPRNALKDVPRPPDHDINEASTVRAKAGERTPRLYKDQFVSSLAAPSPTLTTQQAFAEVMPWFNTTVGTDDSDAEFEAQFKNDSNTAINDDMFASAFGKFHHLASGKPVIIRGKVTSN